MLYIYGFEIHAMHVYEFLQDVFFFVIFNFKFFCIPLILWSAHDTMGLSKADFDLF